jgi:hypothetical protein
MPDALNPPVFIGGHWVLATLEDAAGGFVRCHASLAVGEAEVLDAAAVDVQVFSAKRTWGWSRSRRMDRCRP